MTIELTNIAPRTPRRVRLSFSNTLAAGAFGTVPFYSFIPADERGSPTFLKSALIVPNSPNVVEIVLSDELIPGAPYTISAIGVPCIDTSVSTGASVQQFSIGSNPNGPVRDTEPSVDNGEALFYGRDLIWNGRDFEELPNGDLARISGAPNAIAAITRRMFSDGLPWNRAYGAHPRSFVDAPQTTAVDLKSNLAAQAYADDRTKKAVVTFDFDDKGNITYQVNIDLIGDLQPTPISVTVRP